MLVMYGDNGTLMLALTQQDVEDMQTGLTKTFYPGVEHRFLTQNVIVMFGKTKADVVDQIKRAGVRVTEEQERAYQAGERTDKPPKAN